MAEVLKTGTLDTIKGGSGAKSTPAIAGHGSSRSYPKGGAPSMTADFNPMKHMPREITGVGSR